MLLTRVSGFDVFVESCQHIVTRMAARVDVENGRTEAAKFQWFVENQLQRLLLQFAQPFEGFRNIAAVQKFGTLTRKLRQRRRLGEGRDCLC